MKAKVLSAVVAAAGLTLGMAPAAFAAVPQHRVSWVAEYDRWVVDYTAYRAAHNGDDIDFVNDDDWTHAWVYVRARSCGGQYLGPSVLAKSYGTRVRVLSNAGKDSCWRLEFKAARPADDALDVTGTVYYAANFG